MKITLAVATMCLLNTASCAESQVVTTAKAPVLKTGKLATPESLFLLRCFLDKDHPFAVDAVFDNVPNLFSTAPAKTEYFKDFSSVVSPYGSERYIHPGDIKQLSQSLISYAERAAKRGEYKNGTVKRDSASALTTAINVLIAPTYLNPPRIIRLSDDSPPILGIYNYLNTVVPIAPSIVRLRDSLNTIDSSQGSPLAPAKERATRIRQITRDYAKRQLPFLRKKGWGKATEENADTRAYVKLFEEQLPILREQLTLLKTDIDKGFAELQKQQDAKDKTKATEKATPK